jgi:hypothetical protein
VIDVDAHALWWKEPAPEATGGRSAAKCRGCRIGAARRRRVAPGRGRIDIRAAPLLA